MAFILGGTHHNKDPRVLTRSSNYYSRTYYMEDRSDRNSDNADFWSSNALFHDAITSTDYSSGVAKQIVSISGSSGFMYGAMSPSVYSADSDKFVTWTIVVDGVSYTIQQGAGTRVNTETRFTLGAIMTGINYRGTANYTNGVMTVGDNTQAVWDTTHGNIDVNTGSSSDSVYIGRLDTVSSDQKVYFANSLVVSCSIPANVTASYHKYSCVIYLLL